MVKLGFVVAARPDGARLGQLVGNQIGKGIRIALRRACPRPSDDPLFEKPETGGVYTGNTEIAS